MHLICILTDQRFTACESPIKFLARLLCDTDKAQIFELRNSFLRVHISVNFTIDLRFKEANNFSFGLGNDMDVNVYPWQHNSSHDITAVYVLIHYYQMSQLTAFKLIKTKE